MELVRFRSSVLLVLGEGGGNSVHIGDTLLGEGLTSDKGLAVVSLVLDGADEELVLELSEAVTDDLTGRLSAVLGAGTVSLLGAVVLTEGVDTGSSLHVELVGDRSGANVKPVDVVGREILLGTGLIIGGPLGMSNLVTLLEVLGEGLNELVSGNALDGNTLISVDNAELNVIVRFFHLCVWLGSLFN